MDDPLTAAIDEGMVLLYNNVSNVDPTPVEEYLSGPSRGDRDHAESRGRGPGLRRLQHRLPWLPNGLPNSMDTTFNWSAPEQMPRITRVSVVRYYTQLDTLGSYSGPPPQVLMRDTDFSNLPQAVSYLEDFQIRYVIGVTAPTEQDNPQDPVTDLAGLVLDAENMIASVRISITARSVTAGLEGASEGALVGNRQDDFIRKTFSTNVNPRNVSADRDPTLAAYPRSGKPHPCQKDAGVR
jgi:hypothetical protein